jgi:ribosome-associated protein
MTGDIRNSNNDLRVLGHISIPLSEVEIRASRSGGPGGQHVNTSSTKIEVRWNVDATQVLGAEDKARIRASLGERVDADGSIRVVSSESRSQTRNREIATARLVELIRGALVVPKKRRPTKPSRGAKEKRLQEKKMRSERKKGRRTGLDD